MSTRGVGRAKNQSIRGWLSLRSTRVKIGSMARARTLYGRAGCEQVAGVVARGGETAGELGQERVGVLMVVADDLPAQEVLWGDVAFDVDEAGDLLGVLVGQQQAGVRDL